MLCRLGVIQTAIMYEVYNYFSNYFEKAHRQLDWKSYRKLTGKKISNINMMVSIILSWGFGIRLGFKLNFYKPCFLYADYF